MHDLSPFHLKPGPARDGAEPSFEGVDGATAAGQDSQRRLLRRNRWIATGLLIIVATLFVILESLHPTGFWLGLARASAESAIIGALADWFAVTALFRRPLGLPIPHTAIVPRQKDRIGEGLGAFVSRNFLEPGLVAGKVRSLDPAERLAAWLTLPGTAERLADRATAMLPKLIRYVEDRELRSFFEEALRGQLHSYKLSPMLGRLLGLVVATGHHQPLIERFVRIGIDMLENNRDRILQAVSERSRWWVPATVDQRVARTLIEGILQLLNDLRDPLSPARHRLEASVETLAAELQDDTDIHRHVETMKRRILELPEMRAALLALWDELRRIVLDDATAERSRTRAAISTGIRSIGASLEAQPAMRRRLNLAAERAVVDTLVPFREEIGRFISEVVRRWDARTVSDRLELAVGSDLQYVRISGTLVAATIGALIFAVTWHV